MIYLQRVLEITVPVCPQRLILGEDAVCERKKSVKLQPLYCIPLLSDNVYMRNGTSARGIYEAD